MPSYDLLGPAWTSSTITWSFAPAAIASFTNPITGAYQDTIRQAAAQWGAVLNRPLQEVPPGTPGSDIVVGWGSLSMPQVGETDYAYQGGGTQESFVPGVTIRLEDPALLPLASTPGATYQGTATTLFEMALHEFGHALGLGLATDPNAVMFLSLGPNNASINATDIAGLDAIYGPVQHAAAQATPAAPLAPAVPLPFAAAATLGPNEIGVFRFFNAANGTQFLTGSASEASSVIATRPDLTYEGLAMGGIAPGSGDPNAAPIYRFFDTTTGTHLLTISQSEAATIEATRKDLVLEPSTFSEHIAAEPGDTAVYRFFDTRDGSHFFTESASERLSLMTTRPDMAYEGVAFYAPKLG